MPEMVLNDSLVRPSVQRISAFGTSPRPCGIACDAGAAPGRLGEAADLEAIAAGELDHEPADVGGVERAVRD